MNDPFFYLLSASGVPEITSYIAAGTARHVELSFVSVSTVRAFPDKSAVVLYNLDLAVKATDLTIIRLRIELGVHYVVVYELNDLEDGFYVVGEIRKPDSSCYYKILRTGDGGTSFAGSYKTNVVYDYMCESGATYTYVVLPYRINTQNVSEGKKIANYYPESTVDVVIPKKKCWAIYGLLPTAYTRITNDDTRIFYGYQDQFSEYSIDEVWLAELDIDPTHSVTHNINRAVYTGNQPMPVAVAGSNSYDSFSLTFSIGSIECPGNKVRLGTIRDIKQWKEFIAKGELTMLKDPDGNVWVGAITSHTYDKVHYGAKGVDRYWRKYSNQEGAVQQQLTGSPAGIIVHSTGVNNPNLKRYVPFRDFTVVLDQLSEPVHIVPEFRKPVVAVGVPGSVPSEMRFMMAYNILQLYGWIIFHQPVAKLCHKLERFEEVVLVGQVVLAYFNLYVRRVVVVTAL